jgi:hypothetical protein
MKWQDAAIIIAVIGALLLAVLTLGDKASECRDGGARILDGQLCEGTKR